MILCIPNQASQVPNYEKNSKSQLRVGNMGYLKWCEVCLFALIPIKDRNANPANAEGSGTERGDAD